MLNINTPMLRLVWQRKIALQVAEKVEASFTFRNATRPVAAFKTQPLQLVSQFSDNESETVRHCQTVTAPNAFQDNDLFTQIWYHCRSLKTHFLKVVMDLDVWISGIYFRCENCINSLVMQVIKRPLRVKVFMKRKLIFSYLNELLK